MSEPPKILVTGATGLVGSVLTRQLVGGGADVRIFHRSTSSFDLLGDEVARHVEQAEGDLDDARSLYHAMEGVQQVYHTAAKIAFAGRDREALHRVNVQGTANVVNAALRAGVNRLVHTSSMAAFGSPAAPGAVVDETADWTATPGTSTYAKTKYQSELEVHRGIAEGLDAVIVNPALIFGVGRPGDNTRRIVDAVRKGWLPAVPPGGTNVVDVEDVVAGLRKAMVRGDTGRRYFLGSENLLWSEIVATLADAFGVEPPRRTVPPGLLKAGAYVAEAVAFVTRTDPPLTRATADAAARLRRYDNTRAVTELGCTFRPFQATARRIAGAIAPKA